MINLKKTEILIDEEEYILDPEDLKASEDTINEDLVNQPSLYVWYSVLKEEAESEYQIKKMELDLLEAELDKEYREEMEKTTEAKIAKAIMRDERYMKAKMELIQAKRAYGILRAWEEGARQRKETLIAFASNLRASMDVDLTIKKEQVKKRRG